MAFALINQSDNFVVIRREILLHRLAKKAKLLGSMSKRKNAKLWMFILYNILYVTYFALFILSPSPLSPILTQSFSIMTVMGERFCDFKKFKAG